MALKKEKQGGSGFWGLLLIPIFSAIIWCLYYGIDQQSILNLLKLMLPLYVVLFLAGELIFWLIPRKFSLSFKVGFWIGGLLISPYYMHLLMLSFDVRIRAFPTVVSYIFYLCTAIITGILLGLIFWSIVELIRKTKISENKRKFAVSRMVTLIISAALFSFPFIYSPQLEVDPLEEFTSYRGFVEREPVEEPLHRVVALGLDGADWYALKPLIDEGKLPNLKRLMQEGLWGTLMSTEPINSPTVWNTIYTGAEPQDHGLVTWINSYSTNRRVKGLWNILSEYDLRSTIMNIPGTYPPEEFNGRQISGFPAPNQTMNIYGWVITTEHPGFLHTPISIVDMKMDADGNYSGLIKVQDILNDTYNDAALQRKYSNRIIDFLLRFKMGDIYGHDIKVARIKYYKNQRVELYPLRDDSQPFARLAEDEWSEFINIPIEPGVVGRVKFKVLEMSDDDFTIYMTPFYSPSDRPPRQYTYPANLVSRISNICDQYNIEVVWGTSRDYMLIPTTKEIILENELNKNRVALDLLKDNDWHFFSHVYTYTDRMKHPTWVIRYGDIPEDMFESLKDPDYIRKEAYSAIEESYVIADEFVGDVLKQLDPQRDVLIILSDHGFQEGIGRELYYGIHRLDGVYIAWGNPVRQNNSSDIEDRRAPTYSVLDVTPNILYLMGLPVAEDMNGDIWFDLYNDDFVSENPLRTIATYNKEIEDSHLTENIDASAIEQLRGLGYLE